MRLRQRVLLTSKRHGNISCSRRLVDDATSSLDEKRSEGLYHAQGSPEVEVEELAALVKGNIQGWADEVSSTLVDKDIQSATCVSRDVGDGCGDGIRRQDIERQRRDVGCLGKRRRELGWVAQGCKDVISFLTEDLSQPGAYAEHPVMRTDLLSAVMWAIGCVCSTMASGWC